MTKQVEAARVISKLLAKRPTSLEEVPNLIAHVQRALSDIDGRTANAAEELPVVQQHPARQGRPRRRRSSPQTTRQSPSSPATAIPASNPVVPALVRRTEAISLTPVDAMPAFTMPQGKSVRGVVQWFDNRASRGTLRLPGLSRDVQVDAATLSASGISRLFKGQEIEAELDGAGDTPKIVALHLANAAPTSPVSGGMVRDRHAKPVVVELKRETHRRVTARAEAELALAPRRVR